MIMKPITCLFAILFAALSIHDGAFLCAADESRIVSWNSHSRQFIDPPAFQLLPLAKAANYQAIVKQGGQSWSVESPHPWLDLSPIWDKVPLKWFELTFRWLDAEGKALAEETSWRVKARLARLQRTAGRLGGGGGPHHRLSDPRGAEGTAPYREPGMPVWMWSAASPTPEPTREMLGPAYENQGVLEEFRNRHKWAESGHPAAYPACIVPAIIWSMTAHAQLHRPQSETALKMAHIAADWALKNRLPDEGVVPLFPYSTIAWGRFGDALEKDNINLTRASWMGLGMVSMYEATKEQKYLDYARHIAAVTAKFQAADGSFPYRVKFKTGEVKEAYCTGGIQFSLLVEAPGTPRRGRKIADGLAARHPMDAGLSNGIVQLARGL